MTDFNFFMPIAKLDAATRTISGYASTPAKDSDGEVITLKAVKAALPGYMTWGNVREMHKLSAVGVAQEANIDDKGLFLTARIVDDGAWKKCVEGVYKGFSIGGRKLDKNGNKVTAIEMTEISVVDRPANPECSFALAKSEGGAEGASGYLLAQVKLERTPEQKALRKMARAVGDLTKNGPPAAHDGFSLPAKPGGTVGPNDSRPNENVTRKADDGAAACEAHGKIGCKKCAIVKRMSAPCAAHNKIGCAECALDKGGDRPGEGKLPYGNEKYADPGYQADGKKRYPLTEGGKPNEVRIRAAWNYIHKKKNAGKYSPEHSAAIKAKIVRAWKKHVDPKGPPAAAESTAKAEVAAEFLGLEGASFLTLSKGMRTAGDLSYVFDTLRGAQRSLMAEGKREGGDKKDQALAARLGAIAKDLSGVIGDKAGHEGDEATTMTDADDQYLHNMLGADGMSTTLQQAAVGDPIGQAILDMVKRASQPTRAERMANAMDCAKRARKAAKDAREAIEKAHKMHKDAFMAKAASGKDGKGSANDGEFDHAGAMEKLQKAYQEIEKARTFGKAAMAQIKKAAGRAGQRGQEAGDPEAGFYQVPAGVKDLTPAAMAGAKPGDTGAGGQPPMYPGDGSVYAGKAAGALDLRKFAKNGMVPEDIVNLVMEKAQAEGELAALRRLPAAAIGGRRPYAFDPNKILAGDGGSHDPSAMNKALFDGVDVSAFGSGDERAHTQASARTIGNFLTNGSFGKSIVDPAFKGAAGTK